MRGFCFMLEIYRDTIISTTRACNSNRGSLFEVLASLCVCKMCIFNCICHTKVDYWGEPEPYACQAVSPMIYILYHSISKSLFLFHWTTLTFYDVVLIPYIPLYILIFRRYPHMYVLLLQCMQMAVCHPTIHSHSIVDCTVHDSLKRTPQESL